MGVLGPTVIGQLGGIADDGGSTSLRPRSLVCAALQPVEGRPLARPAVGRCRSVAELRPVITWLSTTFFCCCPADSRRPLQPV
ncbi:hypothetical protein FJ661_19745 [Pseudarthrobacter phenanthrenivorans]|nr:hypothetical protein FJ661_19745 [Pseudarthrobacter phenanthrenivorans]